MFSVYVNCRLWDLEDEGIEPVLDRLQGELGADGVSVLVAAAPLRQLRRHPGAATRVFQSRGGLFFQPDDAKYHNTRLKPVVSGWLKARNPLDKVARACQDRGIHLRIALDTRRIGRLAARFATSAVKSAFGDVSTTRVCPHHPDAAAFFHAVIDDLSSNYPISAIELRDLEHPFDADLLTSRDDESLGPAGGELFSVCWCESCLQAAAADGIDTELALHSARATLTRTIESGQPLVGPLQRVLEQDPPLRRFVDHRRAAHAALIDTFKRHSACDLAIHVDALSLADRCDEQPLPNRYDFLILDVHQPPPFNNDTVMSLRDAIRRIADARPWAVQIPIQPAPPDEPTHLVKALKDLVDRGATGVQLDHYGLLTGDAFTAARQAVRYARRAADVV